MIYEEEAKAVRDRDPNSFLMDALDDTAELLLSVEKAVEELAVTLAPVLGEAIAVNVGRGDVDPVEHQPQAVAVQRVVEQRAQLFRVRDRLNDIRHRTRL